MPRWAKIIVAGVLIGALAAGVDWDELPAHLTQLSWVLAGLALLTIFAEMPANAWKWWWSLRLHDQRFSWIYLLRTGCIGFFFNNFLPSAIGGDVYRVYRTMPKDGEKSPAVSAVVIERLVGLAAMLCNGAIGAAFLYQENLLARTYLWLAVVGFAAGALGIAGLYLGWFKPLTRVVLRLKFLAPVEANLRRILRPRPEWLPLIAISFLFQLLVALVIHLSFAAIDAPVSFAASLLIAAAAGLASVVPISISGLGIVEGSIAGAAVALGVTYEAGVLAAIVVRILVLPVSAVCGVIYFLEPAQSRIRHAQ